jgi:hypothetical protein
MSPLWISEAPPHTEPLRTRPPQRLLMAMPVQPRLVYSHGPVAESGEAHLTWVPPLRYWCGS